jgi:hypothetical protein
LPKLGADGLDKEGRIRRFRENRSTVDAMTRVKYLEWPIETAGEVLIVSSNVPGLRTALDRRPRRARRS